MNYKKDFPIFSNIDMTYLDNAATTQRPLCVLEAEKKFYETANANPLRGLYSLAIAATDAYEEAREKVKNFINAKFVIIVNGVTKILAKIL